jgi:ABC-type Mn2+/Zn2+ transport system ATPase subunit
VHLQVGRSNAPIHLVTAVAGAGKSTLVQAMLGSWPAEEGLLLWLTATRELRDDVLLNNLLLPGATLLQTDELLWGGRPSPAAL